MCLADDCSAGSNLWVLRAKDESVVSVDDNKDWTNAMPLGWCPPLENCWERLIKFRPSASDVDVLMRGIVHSTNPETLEIYLTMEGGFAIVHATENAAYSSSADNSFGEGFSSIKEGDTLIVKCTNEGSSCYLVDSIAKVK